MRYPQYMAQSKVAQHLISALENLRKERVEVEARIGTLQKLLSRQGDVEKAAAKGRGGKKATAVASRAPKRGRPASAKPAKAAKATKATSKAGRKKANWSPAARAAARERMRKYWADRKKRGG